LALEYEAAVAVAVTVSVPTKPDNVPTVTAPAVVVPLYAFDAIVGAVTLKAFAVILAVRPMGCEIE
jgi:hypothetical protein